MPARCASAGEVEVVMGCYHDVFLRMMQGRELLMAGMMEVLVGSDHQLLGEFGEDAGV